MLITPPALRPYSASELESTRKFGDGFERKNRGGRAEDACFVDGWIIAIAIVHVGAVKQEIVGAATRAIHGEHAERAGGIGNLVRRTRNARDQENQFLIVAAVDGEIGDDFGFDDAAEDVAGGFNLRQFVAGDFDSLRDFAGLQRHIGAHLAGDFNLEASDHALLKAGLFHGD